MKKSILITTLIIMGFTPINAQNYQTYISTRTVAFRNAYEGLKFQKVDSVQIDQGDSIFWFFPNFDMGEYHCIQPNGPNWSGRKAIIRENGENVFYNTHNDSILIKTSAGLHTPWLAYNNMDSYKILAEVTHHDTITFLGVTDSVKTISFQVYNLNNDSIAHVLNNKFLKISMNYGIIKTFLFRDFPDYHESWPHIEFDIRGISKPELGIQNLRWKDVFDDFYPGDELHVLTESCYGSLDDLSCSMQKSIFNYLNRIEYQDSVKYTIERITGIKSIHNGAITGYQYIHDTITSMLRFHSDVNFNKLSEETIINGDVISYNLQSTKYLGNGKYIMTKTVDLFDDLEKVTEGCWEFPVSDILTYKPRYIEGLGGPYYSASMWDSYTERKLVYYKKGGLEWGSALTIVDETGTDSVDEPMISVFPNPARDYIWLKADIGMPVLFEIIDLHGSVLLAELLDSKQHQIDTSKLKAGVYIYRVSKGELRYQTGMLMIK